MPLEFKIQKLNTEEKKKKLSQASWIIITTATSRLPQHVQTTAVYTHTSWLLVTHRDRKTKANCEPKGTKWLPHNGPFPGGPLMLLSQRN